MGIISGLFQKQIQQQVQQQIGSLYNRNVFQYLNNGQPVYFDDKSRTFIEEGYKNVGAVYECVDLIMKKAVASPALIYEVKDERKYQKYLNLLASDSIELKAQAMYMKSQVLEEVNPKDVQSILDQPNELQNYKEFLRQIIGAYLLTGNAYLYMNGPYPEKRVWNEMFALPTMGMKIVSGGMFEPVKAYILESSNDTSISFPKIQVEHLKTFNPDFDNTGSHMYGMSPLRAYLRKIARAKAGDQEINKQLNNGGAFGILSPKNKQDVMTYEQKTALKEKLVMAKDAKDSLQRIFPATISMEWQQIGLPYADMKLLETLQGTDEDIYRAYKVPLVYRSTDASTMNNEQHASKKLIYDAVAPITDDIATLLTTAICEPYNLRAKRKHIIKLDTSSLPEMSQDMKAVADWLSKSHHLTYNEKREVMGWGKIEGIENMDMPLVPSNLVRIDMVGVTTDAFTQGIEEEQEKEPKV